MNRQKRSTVGDSIEKKFSSTFGGEESWGEEDKILVALSGGADSVALLHLLLHWRGDGPQRPEIIAGHLQHQLRGQESQADEQFCRDLCSRLGVRLLIASCDVSARAQEPGISVEEAGRIARLEWFTRWAQQEKLTAVTTAHHRDDQVETVLGNIVRGCGLGGLAGIPHRRALPGTDCCQLLRPLLDYSRQELTEYLQLSGVPWRNDSSNDHLAHRRNRIRLNWLPMLREENPALDVAIIALSREVQVHLGEESRGVGELLDSAFVTPPMVSLLLPASEALSRDSGTLKAIFIGMWLASTGGTGGLGRSHIQGAIEKIRRLGGSSHLELPGGRVLRRCADWIHLGPEAKAIEGDPPTVIDRQRRERFNGIEWHTDVADSLAITIPSDASEMVLTVRGSLDSDRWQQKSSTSRLRERLREVGVPPHLRPLWPVIESAGEIVAVPGVVRQGRASIPIAPDAAFTHRELGKELWHHLRRTLAPQSSTESHPPIDSHLQS